MLVVLHAEGQSEFDTRNFRTEDATGVLLVYSDPHGKQLIAAFNRDMWVCAYFTDDEDGDPDGGSGGHQELEHGGIQVPPD